MLRHRTRATIPPHSHTQDRITTRLSSACTPAIKTATRSLTRTFLPSVQALNEFQTSHLLEISAWNGLDQQYAYPFDTYFLESSIIARDPDTNDSLPILTYYTVDSTNNFSPYVLEDSPTMSTGTDGSITLSRFMYMTFRRTIFTQFFVVSLFAVNWALTGVVLYITLSANEGNEVGESILLLPLSVIVTIPALRALWIGAPVFGTSACYSCFRPILMT